jgi:2',3'-cyclic-nucleotide 2'-phosphodiesterase (5'-nucleotidase family)
MRIKTLLSVVFLFVMISACKHETATVNHNEWKSTSIDSILVPEADSLSLAIIQPYKQQLDSEMNRLLGYAETDLYKKRPEGSLSNLIADIALIEASRIVKDKYPDVQIDFCLLNYGGIRRHAITKGPITFGTIYELLPFENELVIATLEGESTQKLIDRVVSSDGEPISGMTLKIEKGLAKDIQINGKTFDPEETYNVLTVDYLCKGGDDMSFFKEAKSTLKLKVKLRDIVIDHIESLNQEGKKVISKTDNRISIE